LRVNKPTSHHRPTSPDNKAAQTASHKRKVLNKRTPAVGPSIADALALKDGDLCFMCLPDGGLPAQDGHGLGLYYHDTRYLSTFVLTMGGAQPEVLASAGGKGYKAVIQLTNPGLVEEHGTIPKQTVGVLWTRLVKGDHLTLYDHFELRNYGQEAITFPLELTLAADFKDIFEVRGMLALHPGQAEPPTLQGDRLEFAYLGADDVRRALHVRFSEQPDGHANGKLRFSVKLAPGEVRELLISATVLEGQETRPSRADTPTELKQLDDWLAAAQHEAQQRQLMLQSDSPLFNRVLSQSFTDLHALRSKLDGYSYFSAGVPWYATLFGRDSLTVALQTLAYDPAMAEQTLRLLARYQGKTDDAWREEGPGKIMHELRQGELAHLDKIPQTPYYGSVDVTPLYLIVLARHAAWTGRLDLFEALRPNVEAALGWIDGSMAATGYLTYSGEDANGSINQGWKDSLDAIVNADGSLATAPIALVEVQGYVYMAKQELAALFERAGDAAKADALRAQAAALKERFNRDFWCPDAGLFALALQAEGKPAVVASSNPGQALWTGIVDAGRANAVASTLLGEPMFSGWGVRTLASVERRYNPIAYHLGTVWPHDNSLIAAGFRRYGQRDAMMRVFHGIFEAATHFDLYRLPEVFSGYPQAPYDEPVRYPIACHPQAWAAGALPFMLTTMLGLEPDAFNGRLRIVAPCLPEFVERLTLQGLRVGHASVDLCFERSKGHVDVQVISLTGQLEIITHHEGDDAPA
jgi:glycogen debranching enzyme